MRPLRPFDYFEPTTLEEATMLLSKYGDKAAVLAGGVDLIPRMRKERITPQFLVNIRNIPRLNNLSVDRTGGLSFGAMTSLNALELSRDVQRHYPVLFEAIHQIASVQAKCMGTAVGNLCVGTPASDVATVLMALGAELTIAGPDKTRKEPIEKFYVDYLKTSLRKGEMVTRVLLPFPVSGAGAGFFNLLRTKGDSAKVSVAARITVEKGVCQEVRIGLGAVAPTVFRAVGAESLLKGERISSDLIKKAADAAAHETRPVTDVRSTAEYRKATTRVLVARALDKAVERATA